MLYIIPICVTDIKQGTPYLIKALNCYFVACFFNRRGFLTVKHPITKEVFTMTDVQAIAEIKDFE